MKKFIVLSASVIVTVSAMMMSPGIAIGQTNGAVESASLTSAHIAANENTAATVCAACHGLNGISVAGHIPNLAGQKAGYLQAQLNAFKEGARKSEVMNAIAAQLQEDDMTHLAAYFSAQTTGNLAKSLFLPNLAKTKVRFPADYKSAFTLYHTMNVPESKQVKHHYANQVALAAAKAGKPLPDGSSIFVEVYSAKLDGDKTPVIGRDAYFLADKLLSYVVMEREAGWGADIPQILRNENWSYAIFSPSRQLRTSINQAECLACHKPVRDSSYVFTLKYM